jgi:alcohol dehydrogenase, propanol-preferring
MDNTYRAVQAVGPGRLQVVRKPLTDPGPDQVRIRVEACGVCHSDSSTVEGQFAVAWPRTAGHQEYTGVHHDGGYAEVMTAKSSGLVSIPDKLSSVDAAPLLCAGLTTSARCEIPTPKLVTWYR